MFAEENESLIEQAIENELNKISKDHGEKYNSPHEGYAVLLEEVLEAKEDLSKIRHYLKQTFGSIRGNDTDCRDTYVRWIHANAVELALEAVQVAAVCEKFMLGTVHD